jgi:hypothetical protein
MKTTFLFAITVVSFSSLLTLEPTRADDVKAAKAQSVWKLMDIDSKASLRGLHVVSH